MQEDVAWAEKADYLIAQFGAGAVGALLDRIAEAVRLSDDSAVGRLDRLLQHVEIRLQEPWRIASRPVSPRTSGWVAEPALQLMVA
ncbi:hypothetical protein [Rhizorhabdus dicambivorans]|uniref:hypothetical protein n=1 Tax=Rhizorhabdus dicambivorans TaxID=1850238 RepID=UPI000834AAF1|nr:hypothetical protein [Rhizorhabdus dicambivorans]